jgi:transposase
MDDAITKETTLTVGLDVGDRYVQVCVVDGAGEVVEESRLLTKASALERRFAACERMRVVLEAGTYSPWISRLLQGLGHEVLVANPRRLRLIYQNDSKSDRVDGEYLVRIGREGPDEIGP